jgi:hypothetical protein
MAKVRLGVFVFGVSVALQGVLPWTPDNWRLIPILIGIAFIIVAFPGYEYLLAPRRLIADFYKIEEDCDDQ